MKLIYRDLDKNRSGSISLVADGPEDMWHAYNLIAVDDYVKSSTIRRVTNETASGSTNTNRVHTTLTICVKSIHFDTEGGVLSLNGTNVEENTYVKLGAYHTIDLEANRKFTITKREWDSIALDRVYESCDPGQNADLAAVVMQEGIANLCLVLSSMTLVKAKIEVNVAKKRKGVNSGYDKSLEKFFERIVLAMVAHINFEVVRAIIIASPGTLRDEFSCYLNEYALKHNLKVLTDSRSKFVYAHASSGFKHSLSEILHDPTLVHRLNNTKALSEVKSLDAFYAMQNSDPKRASYGIKHIEAANEADAIDTLLIADSLFRSTNLSERKRYVKIVENVRDKSGQVKIFSTMHISGEQLLQLTGVAAILRFPLADIDENRVTDETVAEATSGTTSVDKLTSTLTSASIQENNEETNNQKKVFKKVETASSTPNKKAQKPAQKVNTSKKGNKNYYDEEDEYYEDNYDEYDDYY